MIDGRLARGDVYAVLEALHPEAIPLAVVAGGRWSAPELASFRALGAKLVGPDPFCSSALRHALTEALRRRDPELALHGMPAANATSTAPISGVGTVDPKTPLGFCPAGRTARTLAQVCGAGRLTVTESAIVFALVTGCTHREIADARGVSVDTVRHHAANSYRKLGVVSEKELRRALFVALEADT